MSVIPFVLDGENKTIVKSIEDYQREGGLEGNVILIQNLDIEQIKDTDSSNASYDLRVGKEYRDHRDMNKTELDDGEAISLQPGSTVIIETMECIQFPKYRFGHIVPKVSLLQKGVSNTSSKIDPGYRGKLLITVFNLGKRTIELKKRQKFCTLYVLNIGEGVIPYNKEPKRIAGDSKKGKLSKFRDFIEANQTLLTGLLIVVTTVLGIVQIVVPIIQIHAQTKNNIESTK